VDAFFCESIGLSVFYDPLGLRVQDEARISSTAFSLALGTKGGNSSMSNYSHFDNLQPGARLAALHLNHVNWPRR
jgi:hypothetical protein